jgi:hypothetical protein
MKCWASSYHKHCVSISGTHTFTNMSRRYRMKVAPTCAYLIEKNQTLALFENAGIAVHELRMNPVYDRAYCSRACTKANSTSMHTMWTKNWWGADDKVIGYYCPEGWRRFSLVAEGVDYDSSLTVYHGTKPSIVAKIYQNGLRSKECQAVSTASPRHTSFPALHTVRIHDMRVS